MPAGDVIRVNNTIYSWTSSRFLINGLPFAGIVGVDYEEKRERKIVHAARQDGTPLGWSSGKYIPPLFKMRFLKDSGMALRTMLAALGAGSYGDAEWTFLLQTVEPVVGSLPMTLTAFPCTIVGEREAREEGSDELVDEFDVQALQALKNGLALWSIVRSLP